MSVHILPSQSFQAVSNSGELLGDVFSIVTETCSTTGLCVVPWHQVLEVLPGAGSIMLGTTEVSFIKDKDGKWILPLRLGSRPEHTLSIVVFDSTTRYGVDLYPYAPLPVSPLSPKPMPISLCDAPSSTKSAQERSRQDAVKHSDSTKQSSEKVQQFHNCQTNGGFPLSPQNNHGHVKTDLLALLISLPPETLAVMNSYIQQYCYYIQSIKAGYMIRASSYKREMEKSLEQLSTEKSRSEPLQDHLEQMQRRLHEIQQPLLEAHQDAQARLAAIQNRVQSVFQEATSNSAHRSPRLFVVLPVAGSLRSPPSTRFRVFFLCGCETYTRATAHGSKVVHLLHFSNHEGYDLKDPAAFFGKFGSLVLGMMLLFKHGYSSLNVTVPPYKDSRLPKGHRMMQGCPLLNTQGVAESLVDKTIEFIQEQMSLEPQGEADWDQVLPHLHIQDKDYGIGNLAQSRISESFPDWNCVDHLLNSVRDSSFLWMKVVVATNGGILDEDQRVIYITLTSKLAADTFYKSLIKSCGFWKWDVTFDWDATREDLQLFALGISNASIDHLTVHGHRLQGRTSGVNEHSIRFEPLVELMSSSPVQSMCLKGFNDFFSSIGQIHRSLTPSLAELSIDTELSCMDTSERNGLVIILESCPQLRELVLSCKTIEPVFKYFAGICTHLPRLESLELVSKSIRLRVHCADGAILGVAAEVSSFDDIQSEDRRFLQEGHVSELLWSEPPSDFVLSPDLRTVLRRNPGLTQVEMAASIMQFCAIVDEFSAVRQLVLQERVASLSEPGPDMLGNLILSTQGLVDAGNEQSIGLDCDTQDTHNASVVIFVSYQNFSATPDVIIDLEMGPSPSDIDMEATSDLFLHYGSSLRSLVTNGHFNDHLALQLDENVHKDGRSILKTLTLNPSGLSYCTLDDMELTLSYAIDLEDFTLQLEQLEDIEQQEKAQRLLEDHGARLTGLSLSGRRASTWLLSSGSEEKVGPQKLAESELLTRQTLPKLKSLSIVCTEPQPIYKENVEWIASMVMVPAPLTEIRLEGIDIHLADWELIFKAICFLSLAELSVEASSVGRDVLLSLVCCIPCTLSGVPLRTLNLANTPVARREVDGKLDPVVSNYLVRLKTRAPYAKVSM
ncbi:hypothetical protein BGZ72_011034 [Mortierella alpina]|nr:hypothetical protein BGZ72_011034 [Mortierella alpina]